MTLSCRAAVRVFCLACALLLGLLGVIVAKTTQAAHYRHLLEYGYINAETSAEEVLLAVSNASCAPLIAFP